MNNLERNSSNELKESDLSKVADGVFHTKILFVGAYFVKTQDSWVLIDTGLPKSEGKSRRAAENHFGAGTKPSAIILTHGHFDHAGAALELAKLWNVLIYAHRLEMPYLTGKSDYPPQDSSMGGAIAQMARFFPHSGYDFRDRVRKLPESGEIAEMPGWMIQHTPGHTHGHISLWRESDRTLLAGDALATMDLDSWISNVTEKQEFCSPPKPFTSDWQAAQRSIEMLADLEPNSVGAGHGQPIIGAFTAQKLKEFARNFKPPQKGRYVKSPAIADETGVISVPPPVPDNVKVVASAAAAVGAGFALAGLIRRRDSR